MEKKMYFLIEGCEVPVPDKFDLFSILVDNYIKTFRQQPGGNGACEKEAIIPLSSFKTDHLQLILDFFFVLKNHPPTKISTSSDRIYESSKNECFPHSFSQVGLDEEENIDGAVMEEEADKNIDNNEKLMGVEAEEELSAAAQNSSTYSYLSSELKVAKLPDWANKFFEEVPKERLFQASILANFLLANPFIEHAAFFIANKLKSMDSIAEMRDYLNAKKDFQEDEFDLLANDPNWRNRLKEEGLIKGED